MLIMPGDKVPEAEEIGKTKKVILGPGLRKFNDNVVACKAGLLCKKEPNVFWIDYHQKRYTPSRGETVIGVVAAKLGDIFRVDIGAYELATLSYLAFEGSSKNNRPDVNTGDLLYAKLIVANKDLELELSCVDSQGKKGKLGQLNEGFVFNCSIKLVRRILKENCPLIGALKKQMTFEIAIGMNGRVWIKSKSVRETIALSNAILATEFSSDEDIENLCTNIGNILLI